VVAYVILSYRSPEMLARLVRTLRAGSPEATIAVHHDARRCAAPRLPAAQFIAPAWTVEWGHGSQLAAVLRCLRWALARSDFDWLVLLSGQDYPVRPLPAIEADLARTELDAFVETLPVGPLRLRRGRVDEFARRYHYRWGRVPGRLARTVARADPLVQVRTLPSGAHAGVPAPLRVPAHHGSDWFTLSRRAVEAVVSAPPALERRFLRTIVPTEAFAQTVLANRPDLRLAGDNRRHAVFERPGSPSPRVLGLTDVDRALASGADFARKFDDVAVLDAIDRRVHP
jgi:Core-2/I-Branching enzyme